MRRLLVLAALLVALPAGAVKIDWVAVGEPGNAADTTGFGSVGQFYKISKTEVTNAQYAEFLNAVAASDSHGLWDINMSGSIVRSGSFPFTYSLVAGRENRPVNWVTFYDALRFANWMANGQPTGLQDASTTEDGTYTITAAGILNNTIVRNLGLSIGLPSQNEWYKAAYYDALSVSYFDYPAGTDTPIVCAFPGPTPNTANCGDVVGSLTDVGSYTGSASPYGTFDQGGNVLEWTETRDRDHRIAWGGTYRTNVRAASFGDSAHPSGAHSFMGFRLAVIPEPGTGLLVMTGLLRLAYRRRRA